MPKKKQEVKEKPRVSMPIYGIKVLKVFIDKETGEYLQIGSIFETDSASRVRSIVKLGLGSFAYARHEGKQGKRIIIQQNYCYKIGGIETANQQLAKVFADRNIAFLFQTADLSQCLELAKTCDVIIDDRKRKYDADILVLSNYNSAKTIIDRVNAPKVYQQIHADFENLKKMPEWRNFRWSPHHRTNRVLTVSETAQKGLKNAFGIDSTIVPNVLAPIDEKHRRVFMVLSRATREKGFDRLIKLVEKMEAAGKDFVVFLCSTIEQLSKEDRDRIESFDKIVVVEPSIYSKELLRSADYLIQLSYNESYCYAAREALQMKVPVIASKIPEFEKLIEDGENGYILGDEVTDDDIEKIFNEVPKPKAYSEKIDSLWEKVMEGEL